MKYPLKDELTGKVVLSYGDIGQIKYNKQTSPLEVCLQEKYSNRVFDARKHIEHTIVNEFWHRSFGVSLEEMNALPTPLVDSVLFSIYKPLHENSQPENMLQKALLDTLKCEFSQKAISSMNVVVIFDQQEEYKLRRVNGLWKIYQLNTLSNNK